MAAGDVVPVSETLRQVAPRDARAVAVNDGLDKQAVILRRDADRIFAAGQYMFDPLPLIIAQSIALDRKSVV